MAENIDVSKEDNEPIAYEVAMKRLSKARGKAACYYSVTEVLWNRELEEKATQPVFLESLRRKIEVISPRTLNKGLPMGYMMQWHESWTRLREELYNPYSCEYSFNEFLAIRGDGHVLEALAIPLEIPNSPSSARQDTEGGKPTIYHEDHWQTLRHLEEGGWDISLVESSNFFFGSTR